MYCTRVEPSRAQLFIKVCCEFCRQKLPGASLRSWGTHSTAVLHLFSLGGPSCPSAVLEPYRPVPVRSAALWTVFPPTLSLSLSLSLVRLCDVVGSGRHCSALFVLSQGRGGRDPESEYEREMDSRRLNAQLAHSVRDRFYSETRYARRDGSVSPVRSVAS